MAIHHGVIAATCPLDQLVSGLGHYGFGLSNPLPFEGWSLLDQHEDPAVVGEWRGKSFILDTLFTGLLMIDDLIEISSTISETVAAVGGETVSGTSFMLVARDGKAIRLFYQCDSEISTPFEIGAPLATEAQCPLSAINGEGLFLALKSLGFDVELWRSEGEKAVRLIESLPTANGGPIFEQIETHRRQYKPAMEQHVLVAPQPSDGLFSRIVDFLAGRR